MCKVLVVEDERIVAENLVWMLQKASHRILLVGVTDEGKAAVELAKLAVPDVIIMDVSLKGDLNGIQTALLIQEVLSPAKILVVFTSAYKLDNTLLSRLNDYVYIDKPYSDGQLLDAIDQFCR